ncbi:MAG: sugar transferase [Gracilimonas sp.]
MFKLKRYREVIFTSILDYIIILAGWLLFHIYYPESMNVLLEKVNLGFFVQGLAISLYWLTILVVMGSYKKLYLVSRLDEFLKIMKASILGVLVLFFIFEKTGQVSVEDQRYIVITYGATIFGLLAVNRFIIRTIQRYFAQHGKGLHRAIIIGTGHSAKLAFDDLKRNKTLGMEVLGFIQLNGNAPDDSVDIEQDEILGNLEQIDRILDEWQIQEILVAVEPGNKKNLVDVISKIDYPEISLKLLPDFYQIVSGLSKTNQIFGLPLIEISPEPMPFWEKTAKRFLDIIVSIILLVVSLPLMIIVSIAVKVTSEGPVIYRQRRIGMNGKTFTILKFRTMYINAEEKTGPAMAEENDPRVTKIGYWLRKLRIDEIPQFLNVLKGDMSLVGPRPERPHFVKQFTEQIPLYTRRLRMRPGITGWAQVKWKYGGSLDTVREKTKYDLFYIENASLKMDTKILINTIITIIKGKGQ